MGQRSSLWVSGGSPQRNVSHVKQAREGITDETGSLDSSMHSNQRAQVLRYLGNHKPSNMPLVRISSWSRKAKLGKEEMDSILGERLHCQAQLALVVHLPTRDLADSHVSDVTLLKEPSYSR